MLNPQTEYLHNWHIDVVADALDQCRTGKLKRLIINLPPRSLKSHMASIAFPAYLLGHKPSTQIICASYAQDLADKLAGDCRSLMTSQWYQGLFPSARLATRRPMLNDYATTQRGRRLLILSSEMILALYLSDLSEQFKRFTLRVQCFTRVS